MTETRTGKGKMSLLIHDRRVVASNLGISPPEKGIRVSAFSALSHYRSCTRTEHGVENHLHEQPLLVLLTDTRPILLPSVRLAHPT